MLSVCTLSYLHIYITLRIGSSPVRGSSTDPTSAAGGTVYRVSVGVDEIRCHFSFKNSRAFDAYSI